MHLVCHPNPSSLQHSSTNCALVQHKSMGQWVPAPQHHYPLPSVSKLLVAIQASLISLQKQQQRQTLEFGAWPHRDEDADGLHPKVLVLGKL
jgi:hypothetical protein